MEEKFKPQDIMFGIDVLSTVENAGVTGVTAAVLLVCFVLL